MLKKTSPYFSIFILFLFSFFVLNSCGVILDPSKIQGNWKLDSAVFYSYNKELDSYKAYVSNSSREVSNSSLPISVFFDNYHKDSTSDATSYQMNFVNATQFEILRAGTTYISSSNTYYSLDSFDNSMVIETYKDATADTSFWLKGFNTKQYWPMADYQTLEIYLNLKSIGVKNMTFDTTDDHIVITDMLGTFTKI